VPEGAATPNGHIAIKPITVYSKMEKNERKNYA